MLKAILVLVVASVSAMGGQGDPEPGTYNPCARHVVARLHDISRASKLPLNLGNLGYIQNANFDIFANKVIPLMNGENPYRALPQGLPADLQKPFQALLDLTRDGYSVFEILQKIEAKVVRHSAAKKISLEKAFGKVLLELEKYYGFKSPIVVTDFLDQGPFLDLLAAGRPIADEYWRGKPHTVDGHRLYSVVEAMFIEDTFKDKARYLSLYKEMGNRKALEQDWKWDDTGINMANIDPQNTRTFPDVWALLHDTPFFVHPPHNLSSEKTRDFSNPEFFGDLRPLLPGLVGWD